MSTFVQDLAYAVRILGKSRGFAIVAILILALGIGANVAIFSVVNAVTLRPLPFPEPDRLVRIFDDLNGAGAKDVGMAVPEFQDLQNHPGAAGIFEQVSAIFPASAALTGGDHAERVELLGTSPSYFRLLGADAALGRVFLPSDAMPGFSEGAVISDGLWQRQFGGDPHVIGRRIRVDEDAYTVIGVMPPGFRHPGQNLNGEVEVWAAAGFAADPFPFPPLRAARILPGAIGRLKPGITVQRAQAKLDALVEQLRRSYPTAYPQVSRWGLRLEPVQENLTGNVRPTLLVLLAAVGLLLLSVCVNLSGLTMVRSSARMQELAIRQALGASRSRMVRQLLTESVLLSLLGGLAALLVLTVTKSALLSIAPADLPRLSEVQMDTRVFAIAIGLSLLAGFLFGLMPAWQSSGANPNRDLKEGGRVGSSSARQNRFRDAMVVAEIALSVVLLIGSGLLVRTFAGLLAVSPGLEPQGLAVSRIWIPVPNHPEANRYRSNAQRSALVREVLRQVSEVPGVREVAVGTGNSVPFLSNVRNPIAFSWSDDANDGSGNRAAEFGAVSPSYFQVLKTPLKRGRFFTGDDTERSRPIVVVNEAFARQYSSRRDLIGRQFRTSARQEWQIVGVVGDIRDDGLDLPALPHIYFSIYQRSSPDLAVFLRSRTDRGALGDAVARTVRRIDAELPVYGTRTMGELMSASMARRRFALFLMGIFAVLALFLAAIGVYGVMAYAVAQRSREYSIRIALGAQRRDILLIALRPGLVLARAGTAAGLLMAAAAARLMSTLLVGVSPADPLTFTGVPILLAAVAGVACWIPARRAARISAAQALRS